MNLGAPLLLKLLLLAAMSLSVACAARIGSDDRSGRQGAESSSDKIVLESFDHPQHTWVEMNDPVMGGKSTGTFTVENGLGIFQGEVVDVPKLKAPGFLQALTKRHESFPDVSSCHALQIMARSYTAYNGFRISFGSAHAPGGKFFAYGYKANLNVTSTTNTQQQQELEQDDDFVTITIPFDEFTDFWDDATGDAIHTCHENSLYCPDDKTLRNMGKLAIWAEGVSGLVHLEIQSIAAVGCASNIIKEEEQESF